MRALVTGRPRSMCCCLRFSSQPIGPKPALTAAGLR
jgi:hypothetical protein